MSTIAERATDLRVEIETYLEMMRGILGRDPIALYLRKKQRELLVQDAQITGVQWDETYKGIKIEVRG